jgi:soluble lytic murein transglycosylase-like protein
MPIALLSALLCASHSAGASPPLAEVSDVNPPSVDDLFRKWGAAYGVEWRLLKAVARKESRLNPNAVNNADNESIGLMQVLCRPDGHGGCANNLKVDGWRDATRRKLFDPEFNIKIGAQILAWNIRKYGMPKAIAVYNRWAERSSPVAGPFENHSYVAAVLGNYRYRESAVSMLFLSNGPAWFVGSLSSPGGSSCSDSMRLENLEAAMDSWYPYAGMLT